MNETQQTGSSLTDINELQSTRAGSGTTDTNELQSTQTHAQQLADDLKSEADTIAAVHHDKAQQPWDGVQDHARIFQEDANQYVRENPIKTVFISFGIGFVLGLIFRR